MDREFSVVIERDEDGYYVASVPAIPGCHTQARSLDDLIDRIRECIALCLDVETMRTKHLEFIGVQRVSVPAKAHERVPAAEVNKVVFPDPPHVTPKVDVLLAPAPTPAKVKGKLKLPMTKREFRDLLDAAGLSQAEAGRLLGITARTINRWIHGDVPISRVMAVFIKSKIKVPMEKA